MTTLHESAAALRAQDPLAPLSPRERQIFDLIATGSKPAAISVALGLSVKTISTYRARLFRKLNVRGTAAIVRLHVGVLAASGDQTALKTAINDFAAVADLAGPTSPAGVYALAAIARITLAVERPA